MRARAAALRERTTPTRVPRAKSAHLAQLTTCLEQRPNPPAINKGRVIKSRPFSHISREVGSLWKRSVMSARQIPVALDQKVLPSLFFVFASADENVLSASGKLEWIAAPDDYVSLASGLE